MTPSPGNASAPELPRSGAARCLVVLNDRSRSGGLSAGLVMTALSEQGAVVLHGTHLQPEALDDALRGLRPGEADRILVGAAGTVPSTRRSPGCSGRTCRSACCRWEPPTTSPGPWASPRCRNRRCAWPCPGGRCASTWAG